MGRVDWLAFAGCLIFLLWSLDQSRGLGMQFAMLAYSAKWLVIWCLFGHIGRHRR